MSPVHFDSNDTPFGKPIRRKEKRRRRRRRAAVSVKEARRVEGKRWWKEGGKRGEIMKGMKRKKGQYKERIGKEKKENERKRKRWRWRSGRAPSSSARRWRRLPSLWNLLLLTSSLRK